MTFKECIIFILAINLNPLGLWLNSLTLEAYFNQQNQYLQSNEEHQPESSCCRKEEQIEQRVIRQTGQGVID